VIAVVDHEHLEPEDVDEDEATLGGGDITPVSRTYGES